MISPNTLGHLLDQLVHKEGMQQLAREANAKITGPCDRGTLSCHYAILGAQRGAEADAIASRISAIPGYDRIRALCESEGSRVTSDRVRQYRGKYCLETGKSIAEIDQLNLEVFAHEVIALVTGKNPKAAPLLSVSSWSELAIGIDDSRWYWGFTPAPAVGGVFPKSKAARLTLGGEQWKSLLDAFASSPTPGTLSRTEVARALGALPPAGQLQFDNRSRPGAELRAHRKDLPGSKKGKGLSTILADLRRRLQKVIAGPSGKDNNCLSLEGDQVKSGFLVRFLLPTPNGQCTFGEPSGC